MRKHPAINCSRLTELPDVLQVIYQIRFRSVIE